jgi:hypothetical protein
MSAMRVAEAFDEIEDRVANLRLMLDQGACAGLRLGLPVYALRRYWRINEGGLVGPGWEMTFVKHRLVRLQRQAERDGLMSLVVVTCPEH